MNSLVNGSNEIAVNVSTQEFLVNGAQLTPPTRMGLLNNSSVQDGISKKVLFLKPKVENGQTLLLSISPSINSSVNTKHDNLNNNLNKKVNFNSSQLSMDELTTKLNGKSSVFGKKETKTAIKTEPVNKTLPKMETTKKNSAQKEGNYKMLQQSIETRTLSLLKRLQRLQAKQMQKHIEKQLKGFVRCKQSTDGVRCQNLPDVKSDEKTNCVTSNLPRQHMSVEDQILLSSDAKKLSTKALVNLVKSFSSSSCLSVTSFPQIQQELQVIQCPSTNEPLSSGASNVTNSQLATSEPSCENNAISVNTNSTFLKHEETEELRSACGSLKNNLRHLEGSYDSDATESSSGGESCDEFDDSCNKQTQFLGSNNSIPVDRRPTGKWFIERGAIASRWTWLQAQVADLEFKIRQQNEMYRQLRANKGTITFCRENVPTTAVVSSNEVTKINATIDSSERTSLSGCNDEESLLCVRMIPFKQMKRRKLVRASSALSGATRKIARHSSVQCKCNSLPHFVSPCVLCNGRFGFVQVIDTDCMPHYERIALLDSSCHSVLSLPNDVALGLHFSKFLKKETVQQPVTSKHQYKKRKGSQAPDFAYKFGVDGRKGKKSQAIISSSKLRKKYDGSVKRKYSKNSCGDQGFSKRPKFRDGNEYSNGSGDSRHDSPLSSPFTADLGNSAPLNRRRRSEQQHAFDINNIVIPYSIASSTRVEKLQYKEILTPKWRAVDVEESSNADISSEDVAEDMSDEAFAERHERCEAEERKRFGCVLKTGRGRLQRSRLDSSRSDVNSNCVNNVAADGNMDSSSQDSFASNSANLTSASTSAPQEQKTNQEVIHGTPARTTDRHRTSSSSKRDDSIDEDNYIEVPPYDKRRFPLSDCVYDELLKVTLDESECDVKEEIKEEVKSPNVEKIRPATPRSSTSSSIAETENTADPEWEPKVE